MAWPQQSRPFQFKEQDFKEILKDKTEIKTVHRIGSEEKPWSDSEVTEVSRTVMHSNKHTPSQD